MAAIDPTFQMWATFAFIIVALAFYALERVPLELTSLGIIASMLVFFRIFPVPGANGGNLLDPAAILAGFSSPALITVAALLVIGQGLARTALLTRVAQILFDVSDKAWVSIAAALGTILVLSAFLNNTPIVVMFIPILQTLAHRLGRSASSVLIPLSYTAILGGMTTLLGSSTNILVSGILSGYGFDPLGLFEFAIPGVALAAVGLLYTFLIGPRLLPDRASLASRIVGGGKQFIAQITVSEGSKLVGEQAVGGFFPVFKEMTVRLVQRGEHAFVPPFDDLMLQPGDLIIVAATRDALTDAQKENPSLLSPLPEFSTDDAVAEKRGEGRILAEVMISPASRLIGQSLEQIGFRRRYGAIVIGVQRRARMIRASLSEIRLEAGDVLLLQGTQANIQALRGDPDMVLLEWSATDLPSPYHARRASLIFFGVVILAATEAVPIVTAAVAGAVLMVASGCLNVRQAVRAIDRRVILLIAAALALGTALQQTGGALYLAHQTVNAIGGASPATILSSLFLVVALATNILSNNAAAVLFTPIAVGIAQTIGADPRVFAIAMVFAANCSFASPIGYQTNLLVMGPGHYRFVDFVVAGLPLTLVIWLAFSLFVPMYYGLS